MKRFLFTILTLVALVMVANTAFSQTSTTPVVGATYSYSVTGIGAGSVDRGFDIYLWDGSGADASITVGNAKDGNDNTINISSNSGTLGDGETELYFDVTYGAGLTPGAHKLWIKMYNNAAKDDCSNMMFMSVSVTANNLSLAVAADNSSVCPATTIPTTAGNDALNTNMDITFTVTRSNGNIDAAWAYKVGSTWYEVAGGSNTATYTITQALDYDGATVTATITDIREYIQGSDPKVVSLTKTLSSAATATTTVKTTPDLSGATFSGI